MLSSNHYITSPIPPEAIHPYATYALGSSTIRQMSVPELAQRRFIGDFFGLLNYLGVASSGWYLTMLINKFRDAGDYNGQAIISVVDSSVLDSLLSTTQIVQKR